MWPNPLFTADLVKFTDEILNGKLHFLCSEKMVNSLNPSINIQLRKQWWICFPQKKYSFVSMCPTETARIICRSSQVFEKNIASACSLYKTDLIHFYVASQVISIWSLHYGNILAPVRIYILKVNNRNTRIRCEICSKLTLKIPEQCQWRRPGIFLVNFEHISHLALVFLLVTLNM